MLDNASTLQAVGKAAFIVGVALIAIFLLSLLLRLIAKNVALVTKTWAVEKSGGKTLVVGVHGWLPNIQHLETLLRIAAEEVGGDAVLLRYPAGVISNISPLSAAKELERAIADLAQQYEKLILIGHSGGALLLRKAYLFGVPRVGADEPEVVEAQAAQSALRNDEEDDGSSNVAPVRELGTALHTDQDASRRWWTKVDRFILFAGLTVAGTAADVPHCSWPSDSEKSSASAGTGERSNEDRRSWKICASIGCGCKIAHSRSPRSFSSMATATGS